MAMLNYQRVVPRAHSLGPKISGMAWIGEFLPSWAAVLPNVVPFKGMHILLSERADLKTIFSDAFSIGIPPNISKY